MFIKVRDSFVMRLVLRLILILGLMGLQPTKPVLAATIMVTNTSDSGLGSLRQAITNANSGETITFDSSLAGQTITLSSTLVIDKDMTIDGSSLITKINISGGNSVRVFSTYPSLILTIKSLVIKNGKSDTGGGGIYSAYGGTLIVTDSIFSANNSIIDPYIVGLGEGGAISSGGVLTITNSIFNGNIASRGGAISCNGGTITVANSTFFSNSAVSDSGGDGGAIYAGCSSTIASSTFSTNTAAHYGGALLTDNDMDQSKVINSTFSGNTAVIGGGIANYGGLMISNSTYSNNISPSGGAVKNGIGGILSLRNSILANSVGGVDCIKSDGAPTIENINNLIETTGADFESCGTSLLSSDPVLGSLTNNGGTTQTMALLPESPAINQGDDASCLATDQRGVTRPQSSHCDIGAYEAEYSAVNVTIGNSEASTHFLPPHESQRKGYPGINNGPVKIINTDNVSIMASERVIYKVNNVNTSFSEMMGLPTSQLDIIYWLPWYNNVDLDTQLRFGNVSGSIAHVHVSIAGTEMTGSPFTLQPGESTRQSFAGINNGPVKIQSDQNIVAAERVIYKVNGTQTSFTEMMALPDNQLNTTYWLPWYNNVDLDTQLRIGNVSGSPATVHVLIGGTEVTPVSGISLPAGASTRVSFAGVNNGPVKIQSDQNIVGAERVIYKVNGTQTSFSEMMALSDSQLNTTYWLPWYNNADLDTQLRIGNVSGMPATVHVFVGGTEVTPVSGITLPVGGSTRVSYAGINNGPVKIQSDQNIVAAERVIYKVNNIPTSFSEMMALPNSQLNATYWLPWYNNVDLDTQLRFGEP